MPKMIPPVSADLLLKAHFKVVADHEAGHPPDPTFSVVTALRGLCSTDEKLAITHRLIALARLVGSGEIKGWTKGVSGQDHIMVNEALLRAAAVAPLAEVKMLRDLRFKPKDILDIALRDVDPDGSA